MNSVSTVRVKDYIIKSIREQILSGSFQPGMRLAQEELARELGVSRIPVREALQSLEEQGLIMCLPSRHMVVAKLARQQLGQIFQTIGGLQYRFSIFIMEGDGREPFIKAVSDWDGGDDMAFHRLFSHCLDNSYLGRQLDNMLDTYVEYACGLSGACNKQSKVLLTQVQAAITGGTSQSALTLLSQYYILLEEDVWEERMKYSCRD